jgi:hypothetical protein
LSVPKLIQTDDRISDFDIFCVNLPPGKKYIKIKIHSASNLEIAGQKPNFNLLTPLDQDHRPSVLSFQRCRYLASSLSSAKDFPHSAKTVNFGAPVPLCGFHSNALWQISLHLFLLVQFFPTALRWILFLATKS